MPRLLEAATALNLLRDIDTRRLVSQHVETRPKLPDMAALLTEAATELLGKHALLRRLMDAYTAAGGEGVPTLGAIESAIAAGADPALEGPFSASMRALEKAYMEASGGKRATLEDLVAAIHRGAR